MQCVGRGKKVVVLEKEEVLFCGVERWLLAEAKGEGQ